MAGGGPRHRDRARPGSACRRGAGSRSRADRPRRCRCAGGWSDAGAAAGRRPRSETEHAVAADPPVQGRGGPDGPARRLLREAAGDPDARVLRVPDAVHAGAERRGQRDRRAQVLGRPGIRDRHGQLRSERHARTGARQEGELHRTIQPPGGGGRLAFPHRQQPRDLGAHPRGRLSLRLQRVGRSVRPRQRHHGRDAGGPAVALLLRHRVPGRAICGWR